MTEPLISVIVPIYKVEPYLEKCVDSIRAQAYQNLEIILVDDGSPDNCPALCDAIAQQDQRIRVIHKENGGLSSARNAGLDICTGEYIGFVDSDDWIEPEMYQVLLDACLRHEASMAVCNLYDVDGVSGKRYWQAGKVQETRLSAQETMAKILTWDRIEMSCCTRLFRRELWDGIRMPVGEIGEDTAVMYQLLFRAEDVVFCDQPLYNYVHRPGSITTSEFSPRDFVIVKHAEEILDFARMHWPDIMEEAEYFYLMEVGYVLCRLSAQKLVVRRQYHTKYKAFLTTLRRERTKWMSGKLFSAKDRIRFALLALELYRICSRFRKTKQEKLLNGTKQTPRKN